MPPKGGVESERLARFARTTRGSGAFVLKTARFRRRAKRRNTCCAYRRWFRRRQFENCPSGWFSGNARPITRRNSLETVESDAKTGFSVAGDPFSSVGTDGVAGWHFASSGPCGVAGGPKSVAGGPFDNFDSASIAGWP